MTKCNLTAKPVFWKESRAISFSGWLARKIHPKAEAKSSLQASHEPDLASDSRSALVEP